MEGQIPLPGVEDAALHGRTPIPGKALLLSDTEPVALEVGVATGEVVTHPIDARGYFDWLEADGMLALQTEGVVVLDPETFEVAHRTGDLQVVEPAGDGFISWNESRGRLRAFGPDGVQRWSAPSGGLLDAAAFGDRVYSGSGYDDVRVRSYDLATGKRLGVRKGRARVLEAAAGRIEPPRFSNDQILED